MSDFQIPPDTYDGEEWRPMKDHEDRYLISSIGRVWSIKRYVKRGNLGNYNDHRYAKIIGGKEVTTRPGTGGNRGRKYFCIKIGKSNRKFWVDEEILKAFAVE